MSADPMPAAEPQSSRTFPRAASGLPLEMVAQPPAREASRPTVPRPRLLWTLMAREAPLAVLVAPAGYGKTVLLEDWREHDPRPFAWATLTPADDDPGHLLRTVAAALRDLPGAGPGIAATGASFADLAETFRLRRPAVLVLDDVHLACSRRARDAVAALARRLPPGCTLALASRVAPPLPISRLRARDEVVELRPAALALTASETAEVVARAGVLVTAAQLDRLFDVTRGWPAAVRLALRTVRGEREPEAALDRFGGADATVARYIVDDVLGHLPPDEAAFLRRTSVLERLSAPLCDAVLGGHGSGALLRALAADHGLLVPVDRAALEFRHHPLCGAALRAELRSVEPGLERVLHRRASDWYAREQRLEPAVEHAIAAHDGGRVERLVAPEVSAYVLSGRAAVLDGWLARIGERDVGGRPALALAAAGSCVLRGDRDGAGRWLAAAVPTGALPAGADPGVAVLTAVLARTGVGELESRAARACDAARDDRPWHSAACLLLGSVLCVAGRCDEGSARLGEGAWLAAPAAPVVRSLCLATLAFLALQRGDGEEAADLAASARRLARPPGAFAPPALALAVAAAADAGDVEGARRDVREATRRVASLHDVAPWHGAMVEVALADAQLRLSDGEAARDALRDASRRLRHLDGAAGLQAWVTDAWARVDEYAAGGLAARSALTLAELRVLRFLPSHLSFPEIAGRLHVSTNTVKTQARAVYRKLDAGSRSEAVQRGTELGLVDAMA